MVTGLLILASEKMVSVFAQPSRKLGKLLAEAVCRLLREIRLGNQLREGDCCLVNMKEYDERVPSIYQVIEPNVRPRRRLQGPYR